MNFHSEDEGPPCRNMENLLQGVADGSVRGLKKAYAVAHAAQCKHCGNFLDRLKVTLDVLRDSKREASSDEAVQRLRERIRQIESSGS